MLVRVSCWVSHHVSFVYWQGASACLLMLNVPLLTTRQPPPLLTEWSDLNREWIWSHTSTHKSSKQTLESRKYARLRIVAMIARHEQMNDGALKIQANSARCKMQEESQQQDSVCWWNQGVVVFDDGGQNAPVCCECVQVMYISGHVGYCPCCWRDRSKLSLNVAALQTGDCPPFRSPLNPKSVMVLVKWQLGWPKSNKSSR